MRQRIDAGRTDNGLSDSLGFDTHGVQFLVPYVAGTMCCILVEQPDCSDNWNPITHGFKTNVEIPVQMTRRRAVTQKL